MSKFRCLRQLRCCLSDSRSHSPLWRPPTAVGYVAAFTTSSSKQLPMPQKPSSSQTQAQKGQRQLVLRKKKKVRSKGSAKPPLPGERKAMRKRIVVSNTNALIVRGLQDMGVANMAMADSEGKVLGIPGPTIDALRAVEAFKPKQGWGLFRRPAVVWRRETVELAKLFQAAEQDERKSKRKMIVGAKWSGKSVLLLQALAMAFVRGWVVISLPDAQFIADASSDYAPVPGTEPLQYVQKTYTAKLLKQIATANGAILSRIQLSRQHDLPTPVPANISLDRFAQMGANDPDIAWPVFQALWSELMAPSSAKTGKRPPTLLALDGTHHVMCDSLYMSADFKPIHAHDLALVDFFNAHLSGAKPLSNGGMVLAATSSSNLPKAEKSAALDFAIKQNEYAQNPTLDKEEPMWNPFRKLDSRVMDAMRGVEILRLGGLSKGEAKGVMDYYAASGILRRQVTDGLVEEKWALSSSGIIGELERNTVVWRM